MRYVLTFIWAFLISQMINFVLNSLSGTEAPLNLVNPTIFSVILLIIVIIFNALIGNPKPTPEHSRQAIQK